MSTNAVPFQRAGRSPDGDDSAVVSALAHETTWTTAARVDHVGPLRRRVTAYARDHGMAEARVDDLTLAVGEAVANAALHAYRDAPGGMIEVSAGVSEGWLTVVVRDRGSGIVPRMDSPGLGLGLPVISHAADTLHIREPVGGGTELQMTFALPLGGSSETAGRSTPRR